MSIRLAQMQQTPQMAKMQAPLSAPTIMPQQPGIAGQFAGKVAEQAAADQLAQTGLAESGLMGGVAAGMLPQVAGKLAGGWFAAGGPIGGGQTKEGLKEARALGALTQAEYLKAMQHAGYLNDGGWTPPTGKDLAYWESKLGPEDSKQGHYDSWISSFEDPGDWRRYKQKFINWKYGDQWKKEAAEKAAQQAAAAEAAKQRAAAEAAKQRAAGQMATGLASQELSRAERMSKEAVAPDFSQMGKSIWREGKKPNLEDAVNLTGNFVNLNKGGDVRRQAMAQAGLLEMLPGGPLTAKNYMARERAMQAARDRANQGLSDMYKQMDKKAMGTQYRNIGGLTTGPLGMSDMLEAGKGKDVSKVTYKKKGGEVEDVVEIAYHAPLANKSSE